MVTAHETSSSSNENTGDGATQTHSHTRKNHTPPQRLTRAHFLDKKSPRCQYGSLLLCFPADVSGSAHTTPPLPPTHQIKKLNNKPGTFVSCFTSDPRNPRRDLHLLSIWPQSPEAANSPTVRCSAGCSRVSHPWVLIGHERRSATPVTAGHGHHHTSGT